MSERETRGREDEMSKSMHVVAVSENRGTPNVSRMEGARRRQRAERRKGLDRMVQGLEEGAGDSVLFSEGNGKACRA